MQRSLDKKARMMTATFTTMDPDVPKEISVPFGMSLQHWHRKQYAYFGRTDIAANPTVCSDTWICPKSEM